MDFMEVVKNRMSCRAYLPDKEIPREVLEKIAEAGRAAPSACNLQPWRLLFFTSPERLKEVQNCYAGRWVDNAPCMLAVVGSRSSAWVRPDGYNSLETDLTIVMDHLILAAENYGVSSCWIAAFDNAALRKTLGLKQDEEVFAITPLGYAAKAKAEVKRTRRKELSEVAEFI